MDYYRDYLGRLIITEELDSSVLDKLKKIAGVSGNVKVVLSKAAEKEINTIKNASMNSASRGLIAAALANDTNKSISTGVRKYGFRLKTDSNINEEYLQNLSNTEKTMIIDYSSACINAGLKAEGFIFECLCVNHFDSKSKGITAQLNDVFKLSKGKNSVADLELNYNGTKLDVQCKWSSGDSKTSSADNFGSPEAKCNIHKDFSHYIIMSGNHKKCVIFEAHMVAKQLISNICTQYVNEKETDKNGVNKKTGTWYLQKGLTLGKLTREKKNIVEGLTINSGTLNISKKFWTPDHIEDELLNTMSSKEPNILKKGTGEEDIKKFLFTINEDIKEFNAIKQEVFGNLDGTYKEIDNTLGTMTKHMGDSSMKKKDTNLVKTRGEKLNITSDESRANFKDELIKKLENENKEKINTLIRKEFKDENEAKEFEKFFYNRLYPNTDDIKVKTKTISNYKRIDSFFASTLEKYKERKTSIFNY